MQKLGTFPSLILHVIYLCKATRGPLFKSLIELNEHFFQISEAGLPDAPDIMGRLIGK
jgi:hypothetical protein